MSRVVIAAVLLLLPAVSAVLRAAEDPVELEVLDEGRATGRRQLRLSLTAGSRARMTMTIKTKMQLRVGENLMPPVDIPAIEVEQTLEIVDVNADGVARVEIRCSDGRIVPGPDTLPAVVQAMEQAIEGLEDIRGKLRMSDRGIMLDGTFEYAGEGEAPAASKGLIDSMQQSIQQLSAPFPREPIGVGGRWRTVMRPTINGITTEITATYTATEVSADGVMLDVDIEQSAEAQDVEAPGLPAGSARLETLSGAGTGMVEFAFAVPVPIRSQSRTKTDMQMTVRAGGAAQRMDQTLEADLEVVGSPIEAAAPVGAGR